MFHALNLKIYIYILTIFFPQLVGLNVLFTDDPTAEEKIKEDCVPGSPHITFYYQQGVDIDFVNSQPCSGLFEVKLSVISGDTPSKLANRLTKYYKQIKGM